MRPLKPRAIFTIVIALPLLLGTTGLSPEPHARSPISADEFVRALATHRTSLIDYYFSQHLNPNARAAQDRPLLLAATLEQDWETVARLLKAGACADLADDKKLTPLMAAAMQGNVDVVRSFISLVTNINATDSGGRTALHYAVAAQKKEVVELLLRVMADSSLCASDGRDALAIALDTGNRKIIQTFLDRFPPIIPQWTVGMQRALAAALRAGDKEQIRQLLKRHAAPPTAEGKSVPLLAYAIAGNDAALFNTLLECGADPNTVLPVKCDKDFLALLPSKLSNYVEGDKGVTSLMLAAGLGQTEYLRALLDAGADRNRATARYKMLALYLAAQTQEWRSMQILLGSGPSPEELRIEISLASQHIALVKNGVPIFNTICSTGRQGFATRSGSYVITDKSRYHRSTIYHVDMPYFMRLSCLDFGMHEGVVPNYPASHGCIRLPGDAARKLFAEIPIGTLVSVQ
jgi:ankyrin repeat protein